MRRRPAAIDAIDRAALRFLRAVYDAAGLPGGERFEGVLRRLNRGYRDPELLEELEECLEDDDEGEDPLG